MGWAINYTIVIIVIILLDNNCYCAFYAAGNNRDSLISIITHRKEDHVLKNLHTYFNAIN